MNRFYWMCLCAGALAMAGEQAPRMPMRVNYAESASNRWLQKKVLDSRLLDSMESTAHWVSEGQAEMTLTGERWKDGSHSLRLRTKTASPEEGTPKGQRMFGTASLVRRFEGEDWTQSNRISLWVYPDLPGWRVVTARLYLHNEGKIKIPGGFYPVYQAAVMQNHAWNQVVWEITDLPRDRVVGVRFECRRQGNEPPASDTLTFDIDRLELQRVEPDQYEGWKVAPGRIAFSHTGYQTGAIKKAIASDLAAREFQVFSQETGQSVLTKPVQQVKNRLGEFQVMDFSEIREPGSYVIQAGGALSRPFRVDDHVWRDTIWKAINFFYVERCGADIEGAHRICHRDWTVEHNGRRIVINGGWHDAGDLSQGLVNTSETVYAMFALAEQLKARSGEDALYRRLVEEAKWGLDWINKTRFGDGYRITWATMGLWTNGILGDHDDVTSRAQNSAYENFLAAAAEALAARVLRQSDPELAAYNLQLARADFGFAVQAPRGRGAPIEAASAGVLAGLDLYRLTGEQPYRDEALRLASVVVNSQQRSFLPGLQVPITGFFYTGPEKERLLHYIHRGHEQAPVVALAKLCETFPEHPDWMKWYSGVVLHSQFFQQAMARFTEPFRMLPNSIHKTDEYLKAREEDRENVRQQVLNGFKVGGEYYVRAYPVQPAGTFRGNYGTMLSQAKAVSAAAHLRGDLDLAQLSEDQLHWVVGRNPFAQSTMYGEGYDYQPQYSAMSGDSAGSLPVGIKSRENYDLPYWPAHNHPNYKEVWVHPVARWFWLMADLAGPAVVEGQAGAAVEFRQPAGKVFEISPDFTSGRFRAELPEGRYAVRSGSERRTVTLLPGGIYNLDLRPGHVLDFQVSGRTSGSGEVTIEVTARGSGTHRFAIRSENVTFPPAVREVNLASENSIRWQGKMISRDAPWVAVIVPDGQLRERREVTGRLGATATLPVAWATYRSVESLEKDFADLKAHGVGLVSTGARDTAEAQQRLETARRFDMKYHISLPEITEQAGLVREAGLEPVDAIMIGGVYRGKAIDRHLFRFSAGKHDIIVEPPVYNKGFAYTLGSRGTGPRAAGEPIGHYFLDMPDPVRAEVVVPLRKFDGKQHVKILPAVISPAPPGAQPENDTVTGAMPASSETKNRKLYRVSFDLTGLDGALLDQVGVAVYWPYHGSPKYWMFGRGTVSAAAESTRQALRAAVQRELRKWSEANGGSFPLDVVLAARFGDECFYTTGHTQRNSGAAVNYPLWEYSEPSIQAFRQHAGAIEYPRTWGFPEIYGADAYGWWMYTLHEQTAGLAGIIREEIAKTAPGLLVFRNTTRAGVFDLANDHDGSGQELLARNLDIVHLDPYPVSASGYSAVIPRDMSYCAGLARRYHRLLIPWMQAHIYIDVTHPGPEQIDRMAQEQWAQGVDAIAWLGYGETFPKVRPDSWERAAVFHQKLAASLPPKPKAKLAVLRSYNAWAATSRWEDGRLRNPADWMLQQLLEVWAVRHGQAYDVFEVPPAVSAAERDRLAKELQQYAYVVSTLPWKGAMLVAAGAQDRPVDPATAKEVQQRYESELTRRGWLK